MNRILDNPAQQSYTGPEATFAIEMNFGMNHAPGTGSIAPPIDLQFGVLYTTVLRLSQYVIVSLFEQPIIIVEYTFSIFVTASIKTFLMYR